MPFYGLIFTWTLLQKALHKTSLYCEEMSHVSFQKEAALKK